MEEKLFVRGKNEDADPLSVHPAVIGHACRAAAEASLAVSFVSVPSGSGWMKLGAQEARRLRWEVYFVSHSWFYFSTAGVKTDIATWASCSHLTEEAFAAVRRSGALTERMEWIICIRIVLLLQSECFCSRKPQKEEKKLMDKNLSKE